ncbi:hypothetical protein M407DRAFT_220508 [Tulasnella calospora MUT 4182]|uniref:F-box domain-containing protein n=1 Tax=Tulasnella calospora MUT 4182 TaxID=1051891 RepID=A0A0C3QRK1_9AGAM|nr:hypothetical protein M407DRAFT_220508 [Tulasnella calospora MUT 4182]
MSRKDNKHKSLQVADAELLPGYQVGRLRVVYEEGGTGPYYINCGQPADSSDQPDMRHVTTNIHEALIVIFTSSPEPHQIMCTNSRRPHSWNLGIQLFPVDISEFHSLVGAWGATVPFSAKVPNTGQYQIVSSLWNVLSDGTLRATLTELKRVSGDHYTMLVPSESYLTTTVYAEIPGPTISFVKDPGVTRAFHPASGHPIARARLFAAFALVDAPAQPGAVGIPPSSLLSVLYSTANYLITAMANKPGPENEPDSGESEAMRETNPLLIPEILIRILEFANPGEKATAARVCRRWSDPALEALWQDLPDLGPFLKIFVLLKDITTPRMSPAATLERIKSYSARVRTLRFKSSNSSIHEDDIAEVYRALCNGTLQQYLPMVSLPSSGVFPNLRTLEWTARQRQDHGKDALGAVSHFICPSLKHLHISGTFRPLGWGFLWSPKVDCAPFFGTLNAMEGLRLESLEFRVLNFAKEPTQDNEVALFLHRHQHTLLHFRTWTTNFVRHFQKDLCGLSRLRSLEVNAGDQLEASAFIEGLASGAPEMERSALPISPVRFEKLQLLYIQSSAEPEDPEELVRYFADILPPEAIFKGGYDSWKQIVDTLERARANHPETLQEQYGEIIEVACPRLSATDVDVGPFVEPCGCLQNSEKLERTASLWDWSLSKIRTGAWAGDCRLLVQGFGSEKKAPVSP